MAKKTHGTATEKGSTKPAVSGKDKWQHFSEKQQAKADAKMEVGEDTLDDMEQSSLQDDELSIDFPSRQKLEDQLTAMEQKLAEYKQVVIRSKAELENVRKRSERDVSNAHKFGTERLLIDLLPVVDSLIRGLEGPASDNSQVNTMREGISLTLEMLEKTLQKHGVEIIDPAIGAPFDPESQEAMSMQEVADAKANTIVQVVQKGYSLNGRVIRAAMVIVAQ